MILYEGEDGLILVDDQGIEIRNLSELGLECDYCKYEKSVCGYYFESQGMFCRSFILDDLDLN